MQTREELIAEIKSIGLFCDERGNIYGEEYEPYLRRDRGFWQYPEELADLVVFLSGRKISSFLNIGTFNGFTFNFLSDKLNMGRKVRCVTVDPFDHNPEKRPEYTYVNGTSQDFAGMRNDLVFIDGHHQYEEVIKDWNAVGRFANTIVFHDIVDDFIRQLNGGVPRAWSEIKDRYRNLKSVEFVRGSESDTPKIMGIGVLYRG